MNLKRLVTISLVFVIAGSLLLGNLAPVEAAMSIVVNSTADEPDANPGDGACSSTPSGVCTLRAAVMEANAAYGDDTILLPASPTPYLLTRTGPVDNTALNGDLDIAQNLTILGEGASASIVDGNGATTNDRVLHVLNPTVIVSIAGVTLRNGRHATAGGGIYNDGSLALSDSVVSDSTAGDGGGIFNTGDGILTLTGATLDGNTADPSGVGAGIGGGLYNAGDATVTGNNVISDNNAYWGGGIGNLGGLNLSGGLVTANHADEAGGGLWNGGLATLTGSTFGENEASQGGYGLGGGIYSEGNSYPVGLTLTNVTVSGNLGQAYGGGLYIAAGSKASVSNSAIRDNQNSEGGGGVWNGGTLDMAGSSLSANMVDDGDGGGLLNTGTATLTGVTVNSNSAWEGGGGLSNVASGTLRLINSTVSGNQARENGGGLYNTAAAAYLFSSTFTLNEADIDQNSNGDGGGIYSSPTGAVSPHNTIIAGNFDRSLALYPTHDCFGELYTGGYNLLGKDSGCTGLANSVDGDKVGTALQPKLPGLLPLAANGGPTLTHGLASTSPALDAGNPAGCEYIVTVPVIMTTDQRNLPRAVDGDGLDGARCDIGAFEYSQYFSQVFLPLVVK